APPPAPHGEAPHPSRAPRGRGGAPSAHPPPGSAPAPPQPVPADDPVRVPRLTLENRSSRPRRLSVTAYVEWVLGASRSTNAPYVVTEIDAVTGALFARNHWHPEFGGRVAFADLGGRQGTWTGDRTAFIGRNGTLDHPAALERPGPLSGHG